MNNNQKLRACVSEIVKKALSEVLTDEHRENMEFPFIINGELTEESSVSGKNEST